jgi:predicted GIY-YIG superfamily endonuclease
MSLCLCCLWDVSVFMLSLGCLCFPDKEFKNEIDFYDSNFLIFVYTMTSLLQKFREYKALDWDTSKIGHSTIQPDNRYLDTVIYQISPIDEPDNAAYIGHSFDYKKRQGNHQRGKNPRFPESEYTMKIIEHVPCYSLDEAKTHEQYWFDTLAPYMNTNRPSKYNTYYKFNFM